MSRLRESSPELTHRLDGVAALEIASVAIGPAIVAPGEFARCSDGNARESDGKECRGANQHGVCRPEWIVLNGGELGRSVQMIKAFYALTFMQLIFIKSVELDETEKEYSGWSRAISAHGNWST